MFNISELFCWCGEPLVINDKISVRQPTIREIIQNDEESYFSTVSALCSTSSNMKYQLSTMHLDWEKVEDWEMAIMLWPSLSQEKTKLILGDIDLTQFKPFENKQNGNIVLRDPNTETVIDEAIYLRIVEYLRKKVIEMDNLIQSKQQLLAELEIYKKSLIYEYVTGKKEVPACQ